MFTPTGITLRDDALHKKQRMLSIETFYYDALFDNGYSIVSLINKFKFGPTGLILTGMFLYKNSQTINSERKRYFPHRLIGSEEEPHIIIDHKNIIQTVNKESNKWVIAVSMGNTQNGFTLTCHQKTPGFKGTTPLGQWLVIPLYDVQGTLYVDGQAITSKGRGYHDHNIYPLSTPLKLQGYHFGKIAVDALTITWARVLKKGSDEQPIVVVNNDQTYTSIAPDDIHFILNKQEKKYPPESFELHVHAHSISLDLTMRTQATHEITMPGLHYYRSHLHVNGTLQINEMKKTINDTEISELLTFF